MCDSQQSKAETKRVQQSNQATPRNEDTLSLEPSTPSDIGPGSHIGRYQIRRLLGQGGMGSVFLARDSQLARLVAFKLIFHKASGTALNDHFAAEALVTAKFNHPNIVTVYDVGTHRDQAFIALEYLKGQSLGERLNEGPLAPRETIRIAHQVARGLAAAHAEQVIHGDLKPGNVMVTEEGRICVVDFGVAQFVDEACSPLSPEARAATGQKPPTPPGTRAYMAPEVLSAGNVSTHADIWSFGVMLYELIMRQFPAKVTGRNLPIDFSAWPKASARLQPLVERCLSIDRAKRPSARGLVDELESLLHTRSATYEDEECPYPGLRSFIEDDAALFYGRTREIETCVERLRHVPLLTVVGPSGAGKTSFVLAGVAPRLKEQGPWQVVTLRPGQDPFLELAQALDPTDPMSKLDDSSQRLRADPRELNRRLFDLATLYDMSVLLVVDQLEELFTQGASEATQEAFALSLAHSVNDRSDPVRVVLTIREDFLGRLAMGQLPRQGLERIVVLNTPDRVGLREAVVEPLQQIGYRFEADAVVEKMVEAVGSETAGLLLLQFMCRTLWDDHRDSKARLLPTQAYEDMGGIERALARHANAVIDSLPQGLMTTARLLLTQLVNPDGTRRSMPRGQLLGQLEGRGDFVLGRLCEERLVTLRKPDGGSENSQEAAGELGIVEIVHESLVSHWDRLRHWLEASHAERVLLHELTAAATHWTGQQQSRQALWSGANAGSARQRLLKADVPMPDEIDVFLRASEQADHRRQRNLWISMAGGLVVFGILTVVGFVLAAKFRDAERTQRQLRVIAEDRAESLRLAAVDMGRFELVIKPFRWAGEGRQPIDIPADELPDLRWALHRIDPETGFAAPQADLSPEVTSQPLDAGRWQVEARGGPGFVKIDGRGHEKSERVCGSTWIRLKLPGYRLRRDNRRVELRVPICEATLFDTRPVFAGPFRFGGNSRPSTMPDHFKALRKIDLPTFRMDRTEAPNAAFKIFASMSALTGVNMPDYPEAVARSALDAHPVTSVNRQTASDYCRFWGKRLPTTEEWAKAARGGEFVGRDQSTPNPFPDRNLPWGIGPLDGVANLRGSEDGFETTAPVDHFFEGASPYGILNLAGNVYEWTASNEGELAIIRGGDWYSIAQDMHHSIAYENLRHPDFFSFSLGIRCVVEDPPLSETQ